MFYQCEFTSTGKDVVNLCVWKCSFKIWPGESDLAINQEQVF